LREQVENALSRYAWCYDMNQLEGIGQCLLQDAELAFLTVRVVGIDAIIDELRRRRSRYGPETVPAHLMTNVYIREPLGDEVEVTSSFLFCTSSPPEHPVLTSAGYYHDWFRFDGSSWRIARRRIFQLPADAPSRQ
jgi:hypothetical protein